MKMPFLENEYFLKDNLPNFKALNYRFVRASSLCNKNIK